MVKVDSGRPASSSVHELPSLLTPLLIRLRLQRSNLPYKSPQFLFYCIALFQQNPRHEWTFSQTCFFQVYPHVGQYCWCKHHHTTGYMGVPVDSQLPAPNVPSALPTTLLSAAASIFPSLHESPRSPVKHSPQRSHRLWSRFPLHCFAAEKACPNCLYKFVFLTYVRSVSSTVYASCQVWSLDYTTVPGTQHLISHLLRG